MIMIEVIFCAARFQHRRSSFRELQYICDGDSNGVLYFAGTCYGEHQWVNPVLAKVRSSDNLRALDFWVVSCNSLITFLFT